MSKQTIPRFRARPHNWTSNHFSDRRNIWLDFKWYCISCVLILHLFVSRWTVAGSTGERKPLGLWCHLGSSVPYIFVTSWHNLLTLTQTVPTWPCCIVSVNSLSSSVVHYPTYWRAGARSQIRTDGQKVPSCLYTNIYAHSWALHAVPQQSDGNEGATSQKLTNVFVRMHVHDMHKHTPVHICAQIHTDK